MKNFSILAMVLLLSYAFAHGQQPSTQSATDYAANARYANGRAVGYAPHCTSTSGKCPGSDRVIHIGPGSVNCGGTMHDDPAQTFTVANSSPRYVYQDPGSSCAFNDQSSSDMTGLIPYYKVTVAGGVITAIQDWTGAPAVSNFQVTSTNGSRVLVSFSGSATAAKCLHTDANGNAVVAAGDCATSGSTGTVTSIATTSPIAGGPITSTGTISINANGITATQLATQYAILRCYPGLGDGLNAIAAGTYLQTNCYNNSGVTWTITRIGCFSDNSGASTLNATNGAATGLLSGAVTCTSAAGGAAGTQSGTTTIANGDVIKFTFVADGTSKQTGWFVSLTQ